MLCFSTKTPNPLLFSAAPKFSLPKPGVGIETMVFQAATKSARDILHSALPTPGFGKQNFGAALKSKGFCIFVQKHTIYIKFNDSPYSFSKKITKMKKKKMRF